MESWISGNYLDSIDEYKPVIEKIRESGPAIQQLHNWIQNHKSIDLKRDFDVQWENINFNDEGVEEPSYNDSNWKTMELPALWESTEVGNFDGVVWFRKKIKIPDDWVNQNLVIELGPIDDIDVTFINGKKIGGYEKPGFWQVNRIYNIPKDIVTTSEITIAVKVVDNQGGGGIYGKKENMNIHIKNSDKKISLAGEWKYMPVAEFTGDIFYVYGADGEFYSRPETPINLSPYTPTMLFNGMISPVIPYFIRGAIWYQGEANTGNPESYKKLFSIVIKNWRDDWNEGDFPFYYVQIAPYDYGENTQSQFLRDAQFRTLTVPNTGMVVTLDLGRKETIHPPDKQDVGYRLARWALANDYGENIPFSGPLLRSMKVQDNQILLSFSNAGSGLILKEKNGNTNFLIAGEDKNFVKADVKVMGRSLVVYSDKVKNPVAVRYAWNNTAEATLFNEEGLPAPTFRTDDWSE